MRYKRLFLWLILFFTVLTLQARIASAAERINWNTTTRINWLNEKQVINWTLSKHIDAPVFLETQTIHPDVRLELQAKMNQFLTLCQARGLPVKIAGTYRSKAEQDALYEQGRSKPGPIVTYTPYPYSYHNWGLAFDVYRNIPGREYDDSDGFFKKIGAIGESIGLEWGGSWQGFSDKPHFQWDCELSRLITAYHTPDRWR